MSVIKVLFTILIVGMFGISAVEAVQPNNQACLGKSVSNIIHTYSGKEFGTGVSAIAMNPSLATFIDPNLIFSNLGQGVQLMLDGSIPDYIIVIDGYPVVIDNTCNN